jgi:hypothetical protein
MSDTYNGLVADAIHEYGNDTYNGTISTTNGCRDVTAEFKRSGKSISDFIHDNIEKCQKWGSAWGVCIEEPITNKGKVKSKVEHIVSKGTKKWVLKYIVEDDWNDKNIGSFKTKGDAIKSARKYTEDTQRRCVVYMTKVLESGTNQVAKIEYKSSTNEKKGKYVFFGLAAE